MRAADTLRRIPLRFLAAVAVAGGFGAARADDAAERDRQARLDWIHKNASHCCDHRDCGPRAFTMTFTGWKAEDADNTVPFASVIRWPFSGPWGCVVNRHARCALMDGGS